MMEMPFPPSALSGHAGGHWRPKAKVTQQWRDDAYFAAKAAKLSAPAAGDIKLRVTFYAPDNRGDRTNYPNRMKPIFDGIADALGVNDRRFVAEYVYGAVGKPGRVVIEVVG